MPPSRRVRSAKHVMALLAAVVTSAATVSACGDSSTTTDSTEIVIAAASDLRPAFEELAQKFTTDTNIAVTFSFGSSGQLREQILNGAPFDVFASANSDFVDEVIAKERGVAVTKTNYAVGRIVLWSATPESLPPSISDLAATTYARIAIANPTHAPYGLAAQQAFISAGIWNEIEKKIVYGENISDTKKIIDSGNASIGVIALSLAIADGRPYVEIPDTLHKQLLQAAVVTTTGEQQDAAKQWLDFMSSPAGLSVMKKYGFVPPAGSGATP